MLVGGRGGFSARQLLFTCPAVDLAHRMLIWMEEQYGPLLMLSGF